MNVPEERPVPLSYETLEELYAEQEAVQKRMDSAFHILLVAIVTALIVCAAVAIIDSSRRAEERMKTDACYAQGTKSFACLDQRVQECMASEQYTKEQCVSLIGGNK